MLFLILLHAQMRDFWLFSDWSFTLKVYMVYYGAAIVLKETPLLDMLSVLNYMCVCVWHVSFCTRVNGTHSPLQLKPISLWHFLEQPSPSNRLLSSHSSDLHRERKPPLSSSSSSAPCLLHLQCVMSHHRHQSS